MNPYSSYSYEKSAAAKQPSSLITVLKILALALAGLAVNVLSVIHLLKFFKGMVASDLLVAFLLAAAGFILTTLDAFFIKNFGAVFLVTVVKTATPLVLFFSTLAPSGIMQKESVSLYVVLVGAAFFLTLTLSGIFSSKSIVENSIRIKFFLIAKPALTKTMTGFAIFTAAIFFVSYFEWGYWNESLGKKASDKIMTALNPVASTIIPGASFTMKTDDLLKVLAEQELLKLSAESFKKDNNDSFSLDLLSPAEREKLVVKATAEIKNRLESLPAIGRLNGAEPVYDTLFRLIKKYIADFQAKSGGILFGISVTFVFFFIIKFVFAIFYWLIDLIAFLIFKILLLTGFGYVAFESAKKEVIIV